MQGAGREPSGREPSGREPSGRDAGPADAGPPRRQDAGGVADGAKVGDIASDLALCGGGEPNDERPLGGSEEALQIELVAGARCHLSRTGFWL